jgi:hypothetical protein
MSRGGLPPRRPDQHDLPAPRGVTPGARITRLGGTPQSQSATAGSQAATAFYTFPAAGRLFASEISFAITSNNTFAAASQQLYARVSTQSGINLGNVQLSLSNANQIASGHGGLTLPDTGVPVAKGDKLLLDVNNGATVTGGQGTMRAECTVFFTIP